MLVSTEHKFCFIHIPRTGGASIKAALLPFSDQAKTGKKLPVHVRMDNALARRYHDHHKFTVVRNPWARYASLYMFQKNRGEIPGINFTEYVKRIPKYQLRFHFYAMNQMRYGLKHMDQIIGFFRLQHEFSLALEYIGLPDIQLPHHHNEGEYDYREMYTDETRKIIKNHCAEEIRLYSWRF
jgi:hypothetical protein